MEIHDKIKSILDYPAKLSDQGSNTYEFTDLCKAIWQKKKVNPEIFAYVRVRYNADHFGYGKHLYMISSGKFGGYGSHNFKTAEEATDYYNFAIGSVNKMNSYHFED